jgi:hypothetical protein
MIYAIRTLLKLLLPPIGRQFPPETEQCHRGLRKIVNSRPLSSGGRGGGGLAKSANGGKQSAGRQSAWDLENFQQVKLAIFRRN